MSDKSAIQWTEATWNPVTGCSKVSPGCAHCYAEALSLRHGWSKKPWTPENAAENVVLHPDRLNQPLRWRKPRRVFVNSMSDLFHEHVPDMFVAAVFAVMETAQQHTFQVLTKRPERMREMLSDSQFFAGWVRKAGYDIVGPKQYVPRNPGWPLPNVWLGVSVENQHWADQRIPFLLDTSAAVRFVSCEPLLGPVDLARVFDYEHEIAHDALAGRRWTSPRHEGGSPYDRLDWVIAGGESGPQHRPMEITWARSIRDQCLAAGVPFFFKQGSGPHAGMNRELDGELWEQYP